MLETDAKNSQRLGPHFTRDRSRSDVADSLELERFQREVVRDSIDHLYGSEDIDCAQDELIVLCQVRNGKPYIPSFIEHYLFNLGAKHIVFLDNGSTDETVEVLKNYRHVSVLRTELPYKTYNVAMKQYLIERYGKQRWTLLVDIDELFDYPFSDVVNLKSLLTYLNEHSYTAVVAHMLDMFPEEPISRDAPLPEYESLKEKYRFYDISNVRGQSYHYADDTGNVLANEEIEVLRGGIRKTLFGNNATLIKHPLVFLDDRLKPMDLSDHWVGNARIADFTGVLLHYKFSNRLYEDARRAVEEKNRSDNGTRRYSKFLEVLEKNPTLQIHSETSKELESIDDLVNEGFVVISENYMTLVESEARQDNSQTRQLDERISKIDQARRKLAEERQKRRELETDQNIRNVMQEKGAFSRWRGRYDVPDTPELERVQKFLLRYNVEHLHGPKEIACEKDELVVLCLLRNGRAYINSFIEHYLSYLGAKHIVFLDNGSTDGTVEALKGYERVTVLRTTVPFKRYQLLMRQYLVERYGKQRWTLLVDIDELFDYPFSDVVSLKALLGYLNEHSYTAVVAHMLDMFSEEPLSEIADSEDAPLKELHNFYDLSNITTYNYQDAEGVDNTVSNGNIEILQGGVQRTLFNLHPLLTKHPLVFHDGEIRPADLSEHWACNARVADFSGVLFHYKLLGNLYELVRREVKEKNYINQHGKYEKYLKVLEASPELLIKRETSRELRSVNDLVGTHFAAVSKEYMKFVMGEANEKEALTSESVFDGLYELYSRAWAEARIQNRQAEQFRRQNARLQRNLKNLRKRLRKKDQQIAQLEGENQRFKNRKEALESQIFAIRSSRSWRVLTVLSRVKAILTGKGK